MLHLKSMLELLRRHKPFAKLMMRKFMTSELLILGHSANGFEAEAKTSELCTACCTSAAVNNERHSLQQD